MTISRDEGKAWLRLLTLRDSKPVAPPNIIGVGAARSGSTTLYHALDRSPDVHMSPVKELSYFSHRYDKWSWREYLLFFHGADTPCRGEISPHYLHCEHTPERIKQLCPEARIVIQLRDPVQRTISHYRHHLQHHKIEDVDLYFRQAIDDAKAGRRGRRFSDPVENLRQSFYYEAVDRYLSTFGPERVRILLLDDLHNRPQQVAEELSSWLGIDLGNEAFPVANKSAKNDHLLSECIQVELRALFADDLARTCDLIGHKPEDLAT